MLYKKIIISLLFLAVIAGCTGVLIDPEPVDVSLLFINELNEEVLVKSKDGEIGFLGVFIQPQQEYLWELADTIDIGYADTRSFKTAFEFFKSGQSHDFTEYVGSYTFKVEFYANIKHVDTCCIK